MDPNLIAIVLTAAGAFASVLLSALVGGAVLLLHAFVSARNTTRSADAALAREGYQNLQNSYDQALERMVTTATESAALIVAMRAEIAKLFQDNSQLRSEIDSVRSENHTLAKEGAAMLARLLLLEKSPVLTTGEVTIKNNGSPILVDVANPVVPVEIIRPLPVPMTAAQVAAAIAEEKAQGDAHGTDT